MITFRHLIRGSDLGVMAVLRFSEDDQDRYYTIEGIEWLAQHACDDTADLQQLQLAHRHLKSAIDGVVVDIHEMQSDLFTLPE